MRLYNVIMMYDVYCVAESPEEARQAILEAIRDQEAPLDTSEQNALPVSREREVRDAWREEKPFIGATVSDEDFERCKGKTTFEVFKMLHVKEDAPAEQPTPAPVQRRRAAAK